MSVDDGPSAGSDEKVGNNLWNLLPSAWSQVKAIDPAKLTEPEGYKVLLRAPASWEEPSELQTYDLFERAV